MCACVRACVRACLRACLFEFLNCLRLVIFAVGLGLVDRKRSVCKKGAKEALGQTWQQQEGMDPRLNMVQSRQEMLLMLRRKSSRRE